MPCPPVAFTTCSEGIVLVDVSKPEWPVEFINEAWEQLTGFRKDDLGQGFWDKFQVGREGCGDGTLTGQDCTLQQLVADGANVTEGMSAL
jgi:hypothetical protein